MYRTILVPLDGSTLSERVLPVASRLAHATGARLILVRATGMTESRDAASTYLDGIAANLIEQGLAVETVVSPYAASEAIAMEADIRLADLIVMATHGRSGLGRALLGSVADTVIKRSPTPVLLIRANAATECLCASQPRLLVALDGSEFAEAALPHVVQLAQAVEATVVLLRVAVPVDYVTTPAALIPSSSELRHFMAREEVGARSYLQHIATRYFDGLAVETVVRVGQAAESIRATCAEYNASCVIMSTHGRSGLGRLVFGSVATHVLQHANTPVMLVHPAVQPTGATIEAGALMVQ